MEQVNTKEEAIKWFLSNRDETVMVINTKGEAKICDNYPDAEEH